MTTNQTLQAVRLAVRPLGLCLLFALLVTTAASAQTPYTSPEFAPRCIADPYVAPFPGERCDTSAIWTTYGSRFVVGEGLLNDTNHELGYLVLTNLETTAQTAFVEIHIQGDVARFLPVSLAPGARVGLDLRTFQAFQGGLKIWTTVVYFEKAGFAGLKVYALNAEHPVPLAFASIDKDGVPIK